MQNRDNQTNEQQLSPVLIKRKEFVNDFSLLLVGVEKPDSNSMNRKELLLNPANYIIKPGDIGYIISQSKATATRILQKFNTKNSIYQQRFEKTIKHYEENLTNEDVNVLIKDLYSNLRKPPKKLEDRIKQISLPTKDVLDLNNGENIRGHFINHIIIKGSLLNFANIVHILRFYSEKPVILFSEQDPDYNKWNKLKESYSNIFYVKGMQHSLNHIHELSPHYASKILVMPNSANKDAHSIDTDSIVFARILIDFFKINRVLIELVDETMIRFLDLKPKFDLLSQSQDISFFWPSFVKGNIHYTSLLMSVIARSIYNPNWITFLTELSFPKTYKKEELENEGILKENSNLCMLEVTPDLALKLKTYGKLQYFLMNQNPCIIALAILKKRKDNKKSLADSLMKKMTENVFLKVSLVKQNIIKTINSVYGARFFITNPAYFTKIMAGDKILVMGNLDMAHKINEKKQDLNKLMTKNVKKMIFIGSKKSELPKTEEEIQKRKTDIEAKNKIKENMIGIFKGFNENLRKTLELYQLINENEKNQ